MFVLQVKITIITVTFNVTPEVEETTPTTVVTRDPSKNHFIGFIYNSRDPSRNSFITIQSLPLSVRMKSNDVIYRVCF